MVRGARYSETMDQPPGAFYTLQLFNAGVEYSPLVIAVPIIGLICPPHSRTWVCADWNYSL